MTTTGFNYKGLLGGKDEFDILYGSDWTQSSYVMEFDTEGTGITFNKKHTIVSSFYFHDVPTTPAFQLFDQSFFFTVDSACINFIGAKDGYPRLYLNEEMGSYETQLILNKQSAEPASVIFKPFPSSTYSNLTADFLFDIPKCFFYFSVNATPELSLDKMGSVLYKEYSFILEPIKLSLIPVKIIKNEVYNSWSVITSACLKKPRYYPFDTAFHTQSAYNLIIYENEKDLRKNGLESYDYVDIRPFTVLDSFVASDLEIEANIPPDLYIRIPKTIFDEKYFVEYDLGLYSNCVKKEIVSAEEFNRDQEDKQTYQVELIDEEIHGDVAKYGLVSNYRPKINISSFKFSYDLNYSYFNYQTELPETTKLGEDYSPAIRGKTVWQDGLGAHNNGFHQTPIVSTYVNEGSVNQLYQFLQYQSPEESGDLGDSQFCVVSAHMNYDYSFLNLFRTGANSYFYGVSTNQDTGIEVSYEYETYYYTPDASGVQSSDTAVKTNPNNWYLPEEWDLYGTVDQSVDFRAMWADETASGLILKKPGTRVDGMSLLYDESSTTYEHGHYIRNSDYSAVQFNSDGSNTNGKGPSTLEWNIPKPPHCYSFKIRTVDIDGRLLDTSNLRFRVKSTILKQAAKEVWVENYIASDHHHVAYPLTEDWTTEDDFISYELIIDHGYLIDEFAKNIKVYTSTKPELEDKVLNFSNEYNLQESPWLPASEASCLRIKYVNSIAGKFKFAIKTKLKHSGGIQESISPLIVEFAAQTDDWVNPATPIFLEKIKETPTLLKVSAAHLTSSQTWPNRNLLNSKIIWSTYDKHKNPYIYGEGPIIWAVSNKDEYLQSIINGEAYLFGENTWSVYVSGYNEGDYLSLKSERYDEESFVQVNSLLTIPNRDLASSFNIYELDSDLKQFTKTINVAGGFIEGDMNWSLLENDSLYWEWAWDGKLSTNNIPVTAYDLEGNLYTAGTMCKTHLVSALELQVEAPVANNDYPEIHNLEIKLVSVSSFGRLETTKIYHIEDFPPDENFNTRMMVSYNATSIFNENLNNVDNTYIADTDDSQTKNLIITRKNQGGNLLNQFLVHVDLTALKKYGIENYQVKTIKGSEESDWESCEVHNNYQIEVFDMINFMDATALDVTSMKFIQRVETKPVGWSQTYTKDFEIQFYLADPQYFERTDFISYPYISWFPWTDQIFVLNNTKWDENYYSNWSYAPTALYSHDDTVGFYFCLSANNALFDTYTYTLVDKNDKELYTVQAPAHCSWANNLIHIPSLEEIKTEMFSPEGLKVALRASNEFFPPDLPIEYKALTPEGVLETLYYPITSESWDANLQDTYYPDVIVGPGPTGPWNGDEANPITNHPYKKSLRLHEYEDALHYNFVFFTHDPLVNMAYQNNIRIWQSIGMLEQTPLSILDIKPLRDDVLYTVTYLVSCANWTDTVTVPFTKLENPDYSIYELKLGDGAQVGYIDLNEVYTPFKVVALSYDIQIGLADKVLNQLHAHWQNYRGIDNPLPAYLEHRVFTPNDPEYILHDVMVKNEAYDAQIYLSTYHSITGKDINLELTVPTLYGTTYEITLNYGDGTLETAELPDMSKWPYPFTYKTSHSYDTPGTYYISYSAVDMTNPLIFTKQKTLDNPVQIYKEYDRKEYSNLRVYGESLLELPHNLDDVLIKPNEYCNYEVVNHSIRNMLENIEYIKNHMTLVSNVTPSNHFGWLGYNKQTTKSGLRWWSLSDENNFFFQPLLSVPGELYFKDIKDVIESQTHLIILDGGDILVFKNSQKPTLIPILNATELKAAFVNPVGLSYDEENNVLFVLDPVLNKVSSYKIIFNYNSCYFEQINIIGGYGDINEVTKFDTPTEMQLSNKLLYILDYQNRCVKAYTQDLIWQKTFFVEEFLFDLPSNFAVNDLTKEVYILTVSGNVYIFNQDQTLKLIRSGKAQNVSFQKIFFDLPHNFLYIATSERVLKFDVTTYTFLDRYILNDYIFTDNQNLQIRNARNSLNCSILIVGKHYILKSHDFMELHYMTHNVPFKYWPYDDIKVLPNESVTHNTYNRVYKTLTQNIKALRDTICSKLNLIKEKTEAGTLSYYGLTPISTEDKCLFVEDVEDENLLINPSDFNIPQIVNKPLFELFKATEQLLNYIQISDLNINLNKCVGLFCWSWKQLSVVNSNMSFPAIQMCGFNPITYEELMSNNSFEEYTYAPNNTWEQASSPCCDSYKKNSPLNLE